METPQTQPEPAIGQDLGQKKKPTTRKKPTPRAIPIEEVVSLVKAYQDDRIRALAALLYLTGARISELLDITRRDIAQSEDKRLILITVKTLKRRDEDKAFRTVPIPSHGYEYELLTTALPYVNRFQPGERLFEGMSRESADYYLRKQKIAVMVQKGKEAWNEPNFKIHAHYYRHLRATHLVQYYGFNTAQLQAFFGWALPDMAAVYVELGGVELGNVFFKN